MATEFQCRICLKEETNDKNLIVPCHCMGDQRYVHRDCLDKWRSEDRSNLTRCQQCNFDYETIEVPVTTGNRWYRRWTYTKSLVSEIIFYIIISIIYLVTTTVVIYWFFTSKGEGCYYADCLAVKRPWLAAIIVVLTISCLIFGICVACALHTDHTNPMFLPLITAANPSVMELLFIVTGFVYGCYFVGEMLVEIHQRCESEAWRDEDAEIHQVRDLKGERTLSGESPPEVEEH